MPLFYHKTSFWHHARLLPACWSCAVLTLLMSAAPAKQMPTRIAVPHGHGTVNIHGLLTGPADRAEFMLHAQKGQHLSLSVRQGGPSVVMLYFPGGQHDGAPGGIQDTLPQTGQYRITITEHQMAEAWDGPFVLRVTLRSPHHALPAR